LQSWHLGHAQKREQPRQAASLGGRRVRGIAATALGGSLKEKDMLYEFKLVYKLPSSQANIDHVMQRLGAAHCTDALVGLGWMGHISLEFMREAGSARKALQSAMSDVKRALPEAVLIEASPDWVGLTDVADLMGVSRQNMRQMMHRHIDHFPVPVHVGSSAIWHLKEILDFLSNRHLETPRHMTDLAAETMWVNRNNQDQLHPWPARKHS